MTKLRTRTEAGPGYSDPDRVRQEAERWRGEEDRWAPAAFSDAQEIQKAVRRGDGGESKSGSEVVVGIYLEKGRQVCDVDELRLPSDGGRRSGG